MNYPNTFTISSQPFYDEYNQNYRNILTVNIEPMGPLQKFIRRIQMPYLSPFQKYGNYNSRELCGLAITRLPHIVTNYDASYNYNNKCVSELMNADETPGLISFLLSNGYQIETQITNMMNLSNVKTNNKTTVFTATYYGDKPTNITYMR